MTTFEVIAVDANPIVSAIIGGKAIEVLYSPHVGQFITTDFTIGEVRKHIPSLAQKSKLKKAGITESEMLITLEALSVKTYPRPFYQVYRKAAKGRIEDPKDVDILALALKTEAVIWTNDLHFDNCGVTCIDTAKLLKILANG